MAWIRELKTVWQICFRDRSTTPDETTNSVPKDEYSKSEAEEDVS